MTNKIPMMVPNLGQPQPVDVSKATIKACELCGGPYFDLTYRLGVVSRMAPGNNTGQDVLIKFEAFICRGCGNEYGKAINRGGEK